MTQNHIIRWKFLRLVDGKIKSDSGDYHWKIGKKKIHKGKISLCHAGFHCSQEILQAFSHVQGEILAEVECSGRSQSQEDKEVYSVMTIQKAYLWQKRDSVALAVYAAEQVIDIFEKKYPDDQRPRKAIEAAKEWLKNPTPENRAAAVVAAADASRAAAWASRAAADASRAAAWASRAAVVAAVRNYSKSIIPQVEIWMKKRVKKLEQYKEVQK